MFMVNLGKYAIHGTFGSYKKGPLFNEPFIEFTVNEFFWGRTLKKMDSNVSILLGGPAPVHNYQSLASQPFWSSDVSMEGPHGPIVSEKFVVGLYHLGIS